MFPGARCSPSSLPDARFLQLCGLPSTELLEQTAASSLLPGKKNLLSHGHDRPIRSGSSLGVGWRRALLCPRSSGGALFYLLLTSPSSYSSVIVAILYIKLSLPKVFSVILTFGLVVKMQLGCPHLITRAWIPVPASQFPAS